MDIKNTRPPTPEEENRKKICLEQLAQDRQKLLMRWPFIGSIIMRMELIPVRDDRLSTASTDGNNIFVDINFYSSLDQQERLFVLAHEVWHSVLLHFARKKSRNAELFNAAADLEIHFTLLEEKMKEPWVLPHNPKWAGLSAEEIYEKLLQDIRYSSLSGMGSGEGEKDENSTSAENSESEQDDAENSDDRNSSDGTGEEKQSEEENSAGNTTGNQNQQDKKQNGNNAPKSFDKHIYQDDAKSSASSENTSCNNNGDGKNDFVMDDDYAPSIQSDTVEKVRGRVIAAAQQCEKIRGTLPGRAKAIVTELLTPELPWHELLKQFLTSCYGGSRSWLPPSRRYVWQDIYLPSMRQKKLKAIVAVDTSESTRDDWNDFFTELASLLKTFGKYELTFIQCDAQIQKIDKFDDCTPIPNEYKWKILGAGGTDFRPVFEHIAKQKEQPDVLVYFTDGYGPAPKEAPSYPVLWVLTEQNTHPCEWGKFISLKRKK